MPVFSILHYKQQQEGSATLTFPFSIFVEFYLVFLLNVYFNLEFTCFCELFMTDLPTIFVIFGFSADVVLPMNL